MTKIVTVTLYPDYPNNADNTVRGLLDAELRKAFTEDLETDWYAMDCGSLGLKYIVSCCDTLVESKDFSPDGPAQVSADAPNPGWTKVGNLHEARRVLSDNTVPGNPSWEVSATDGGVNYTAGVLAVYRTGDVGDFP